MPTFVANETEDEDILFASFGKIKKGQNPQKSVLIKEGENIAGVITSISDSPTYQKIYRMKVEGQEKPVVILGTTDLNNKMGYGPKKTKRQVTANDLVRITFLGKVKTGKGRPFYSFKVEIAK